MKPKSTLRRFLLLCGGALLAVSSAQAQSGTWNVDADGNWNTVGNWLDSFIASGSGNTAFFTTELSANRNVTLGADRTIGNIVFTDGTTSSHNLTISGGDILTLAGTTPSIRITQADRNLTITSSIAGTAGLTKRGPGTLTLGGSVAHTFTGGIALRQGTLALDYSSLASDLIASQDVTLSGGKLSLLGNSGGTTQSLGNITATAGGGSILLNPNGGTTTLSLGSITSTAVGSSLLLGKASGSTGTAIITTTTNKDSNGIYGGKIVYTDGTNYDWATTASGSSPYTLSGLSSYTALPVSGFSATTNYSVGGATTLSITPSPQGVVSINSLKWTTGNIAIGAGNTLVVESGGILITGTNASVMTTTGKLTAGAASNYNLTFHTYSTSTTGAGMNGPAIADNGGNAVSVTKAGSGILRVVGGTQTFTGGMYINEGTLFTDGGSSTQLGNGALYLNGGTLSVSSSNLTTNNNFTKTGGITSTTVGGDFEVLLNRTTNVASTPVGPVTLGPSLSIGDHTLTVRGGSNVTAGTPQVTITGGTTLTGAATFNVQDESTGTSTGTLLTLNAVNNGGHLLTINGNTRGTTTVSGIITGSGGLTKTGASTLNLNAANAYTGATTINGGTVKLGAAGSISNTSGVSLGTGGTFDVSAKAGGYSVNNLSGSGTVVGSLTVSTSLAIGNSPGTVGFGNLTLASASTYSYELTGGGITADLGNVSGTLDLGSATLDLVQLGAFTANDKFTLFAYTTGNLTGTFAGLIDGANFTDAGGDWQINYFDTSAGLNGGTGTSFVTITAIPEPAAALLGGLGVVLLFRRRRN